MPEVTATTVRTWNAADNAPMLAVNVAMGFRPSGRMRQWQATSTDPGPPSSGRWGSPYPRRMTLDDLGFSSRAIHAGQEPDPTTGAVVRPSTR